MTALIEYHHQPPALWSMYSRAILSKSATSDTAAPTRIPALSASLLGVTGDARALARYRAVCGFAPHRWMPATWPHILAFPLHMRLLTDPAFPLPLLGLVHLSNRITQRRRLLEGECLDIHCHLGEQRSTERGIEFDIVTEAHSAGRLVWSEISTTLHRLPKSSATSTPRTPPALPRYAHTLDVHAPESLGRRYGRVSGDLNPIHLHALSARLFGFPRAIAHGMWSKAHCIAMLEQQIGWGDDPFTIHTAFKKPLFLPGNAKLNWELHGDRLDYQLLNAKGDAPHLSGDIQLG